MSELITNSFKVYILSIKRSFITQFEWNHLSTDHQMIVLIPNKLLELAISLEKYKARILSQRTSSAIGLLCVMS